MLTALHLFGPQPCKRVAFYYEEQGAAPDRVDAERVIYPDGFQPQEGETMKCGCCDTEVHPRFMAWVPGKLVYEE